MRFVNKNVNPKGWAHEGDCVVRSLVSATGCSWNEVYNELCMLGAISCRMPNSKPVWEKYLKSHGWVKHPMPRHKDGTKCNVAELIDEHPEEKMVIIIPKHNTYAECGTLVDTWNCSHKFVNNYWTKSQ